MRATKEARSTLSIGDVYTFTEHARPSASYWMQYKAKFESAAAALDGVAPPAEFRQFHGYMRGGLQAYAAVNAAGLGWQQGGYSGGAVEARYYEFLKQAKVAHEKYKAEYRRLTAKYPKIDN